MASIVARVVVNSLTMLFAEDSLHHCLYVAFAFSLPLPKAAGALAFGKRKPLSVGVVFDEHGKIIGLTRELSHDFGLVQVSSMGLSCVMNNQVGNSYNLREKSDRDERNWHARMEQLMIEMAEMYQKAIHNIRSAKDQRLADMAQSHEKNMTHILELMQQGNTGVPEST
ncbi:hypothetical protein Syun_014543 [Stephania yunnanensis]|uniref:Uncharacterized protein n=1 Tax=Stephania yunnanensis TaxID=152371 RepID=A0AAP0JLA1_9MAGN